MDRVKNLFLFRMADDQKALRRDEPSMLVKGFCTAALALLIVDLIVLVFFFRTGSRQSDLLAHNFTQILERAKNESEFLHAQFSEKAKKINMENVNELKEHVSSIKQKINSLSSLSSIDATLPSLPSLIASVEKAKGKSDLQAVSQLFLKVGNEFKELEAKLTPLDKLKDEYMAVQALITHKLAEINENMGNFHAKLKALAKHQHQNQYSLYSQIRESLTEFNTTLSEMERNGRPVKLNQFFSFDFLEFDRDLVPFASEFDSHSGAWLTKQSPLFYIRLPRVYLCSLKAVVYSDKPFSFKFELVDSGTHGQEQPIYTSSIVRGGFERTASVDDLFIVNLDAGEHRLALRSVSVSDCGRVNMSHKELSCLSYRHFSPAK